MDRIFRGLPFVFIYLDDVLVASRTRKLHIEHLQVVLELLVQNGLVLNLDKCSFIQHEIEYLGHKITVDGIVPLRHHVDAPPTTSLGCTWSLEVPRHDKLLPPFLPGIERTLRPLTDALAGNPRVLNWSQKLQDAFDRAKSALSSAVSLTHPSPSAEVSLVTDASNTHVGAALQQKESGGWHPLALRQEPRKFHILTDHLPLVSAL